MKKAQKSLQSTVMWLFKYAIGTTFLALNFIPKKSRDISVNETRSSHWKRTTGNIKISCFGVLYYGKVSSCDYSRCKVFILLSNVRSFHFSQLYLKSLFNPELQIINLLFFELMVLSIIGRYMQKDLKCVVRVLINNW